MANPAIDSRARLEEGGSGDLDDVMQVMEAAFGNTYGEAWTRSQCAGILPMAGVALIIARDGDSGQATGFSLSRSVADDSELLLLAVRPERQRRGIGRLLLDDFMARAHALGATRTHLEVRDGNPAVSMYEAAGFALAGRRRNYYFGSDGRRFDALTLVRQV
jgi:ribosomal-protein-alanine N-acetyltransferase